MGLVNTIGMVVGLAALTGAPAAFAQLTTGSDRFALTVEGYANLTTDFAQDAPRGDRRDIDDVRTDLAIRALGQLKLDNGPDLGVRLVAEGSGALAEEGRNSCLLKEG